MLPAEQLEPMRLEAERRFLLEDVPWSAYVALRDALEGSGTRMTYLEGRLELMSPPETHEEETKLIARLLEAWADQNDVELRGFRSTTYRRETERRGLEADECYTVGPKAKDAVPKIAKLQLCQVDGGCWTRFCRPASLGGGRAVARLARLIDHGPW